MSNTSNIALGFLEIRKAELHFTSYYNQFKKVNPIAARKFNEYIKKLQWMQMDFKTLSKASDLFRESIRKEFNGDAFIVDAIAEKAAMLTEDKREKVEELIDKLVSLTQEEFAKIKEMQAESDIDKMLKKIKSNEVNLEQKTMVEFLDEVIAELQKMKQDHLQLKTK